MNNLIIAVAMLYHYIEKKDISFFIIPVLYSCGVKLAKVKTHGLVLYLTDLIKANKPMPQFLTIRSNEQNFRLSSKRTRLSIPACMIDSVIDLPYHSISEMLMDTQYQDIPKPCRKWEKIAYNAIVNNDIYGLLDVEFVADSLENVDIITTQKTGGYVLRYDCKYSEGLLCYGGKIDPREIRRYIDIVQGWIDD